MLSYASNIVFIFFMTGAMTEIRDEIRLITGCLWEFVVCLRSLLCVCVIFSLLFLYSIGGGNHRPVPSHLHTLSNNVVSSTFPHERISNSKDFSDDRH
jgi:hypothetical protein